MVDKRFKDSQYLNKLIYDVLGTPKGRELLELLMYTLTRKTPDLTSVNKAYFEMGKQELVRFLEFKIEQTELKININNKKGENDGRK